MLTVNSHVVISKGISIFHYGETPRMSLMPVLSKLQRQDTRGIIRKVDASTDSVAVQFPLMKEFLWFKSYELQPTRK